MRNPAYRIITYTGAEFYPLDPQPDLIFIEDVAHALSNSCRFTGHTREFYSVAQHSVLVSLLVPARDRLWALLHDASEAYLADIARPVKVQLADYKEHEERLMRAVADQFGLPWPMPASVKLADNAMLLAEIRDLMPRHAGSHSFHTGDAVAYGKKIIPVSPAVAKDWFLRCYHELIRPAEFRGCGDHYCGFRPEEVIEFAENAANCPDLV